jgi:hypothetical protein
MVRTGYYRQLNQPDTLTVTGTDLQGTPGYGQAKQERGARARPSISLAGS